MANNDRLAVHTREPIAIAKCHCLSLMKCHKPMDMSIYDDEVCKRASILWSLCLSIKLLYRSNTENTPPLTLGIACLGKEHGLMYIRQISANLRCSDRQHKHFDQVHHSHDVIQLAGARQNWQQMTGWAEIAAMDLDDSDLVHLSLDRKIITASTVGGALLGALSAAAMRKAIVEIRWADTQRGGAVHQ